MVYFYIHTHKFSYINHFRTLPKGCRLVGKAQTGAPSPSQQRARGERENWDRCKEREPRERESDERGGQERTWDRERWRCAWERVRDRKWEWDGEKKRNQRKERNVQKVEEDIREGFWVDHATYGVVWSFLLLLLFFSLTYTFQLHLIHFNFSIIWSE